MKNQSVTVETPTTTQSAILHTDPFSIFSFIADVIFAVDLQGIFRFVSPSCVDLFGYTQEEMTGASFLQFIHPDDIEKTVQVVEARTHDCTTSHFENRYYRKDGSIVPITWSGRRKADKKLLFCVARDGSEKLAIEQRLVKAQQLARVANFEFDVVRNCYTYTSDTLFDIFGIDRREHPFFTPELFWGSVHPDDAAFVRESVHQSAHLVSSTLEYRIVRPDGKIVYINRIREVCRDAGGRPVKTIGTIQDVTDRKLSEMALQQREVRFRSLVQNGNDLISIVDSKGNYLFVGENVQGHLGYRAEALVGRNAFDFIHHEDVQHVQKAQQEIIEKSIVTITPVRFRNSKGEWRWVETTVSNHLNNPAIEGLIVNSRDVTEKMLKDQGRRQYEDELRKLSLIAKETNNAVILLDKQRRVLWVNQAFLKLSGYLLEECIGKVIGEICDGPQTDPETIQYVQEKIEKKDPFHIVTLNYKKNGETYWADVSCQPVFDHEGEVVQYFSIATDITERKLLESQLEQERHERQVNIAAATLKAQEYERTIVSQELHDNVNQVLTTVKLYVEMCRDDIGNPKEIMDKSIKLLQDSINEIRSLSKRLSAPSLGKIRLAESVKELVDAVAATNKFQIALDTHNVDQLEAGEEVHLAVYRILQEHLTNILKHAAASKVHVTLESFVGSVQLRVIDNGKGFDPQKQFGGIGIANMVARAESLKGKLVIKSAPTKGCELFVMVPL